LGIGILRLRQELIRDRAAWLLASLVIGFLLMLTAANYDSINRAATQVMTTYDFGKADDKKLVDILTGILKKLLSGTPAEKK
jgi:hypothetical protein